jgi:hypothetical protein
MPDDSYRLLVARLARLQAAYSAEQEQLRTWYDQQCAAATAAVDVAAVAVAEAGAAVEAADSVVQSTDMKAHELWRRVRDRAGPVKGRFSDRAPEPSRNVDPTEDPALSLHKAQERLDSTVRSPRTVAGWVYPVLVLLGAAGAGLGYAAAQGARWWALRAGGDPAAFAPVIQQVLFVVAPFVGLVPARILADRQGAKLDVGTVGVVVVTGLLALGALLLLFNR